MLKNINLIFNKFLKFKKTREITEFTSFWFVMPGNSVILLREALSLVNKCLFLLATAKCQNEFEVLSGALQALRHLLEP